jgi:hypothetical protein
VAGRQGVGVSTKSGAELARAFHDDVVRPLLRSRWPDLPYAAARLGSGSDVLGLDDATSRDHDWGLRLTLLVAEDRVAEDRVAEVDAFLERDLPASYAGLPTRFATTWDATVRHRVEVRSTQGFVMSRLGVDATQELSTIDWLGLTGQSVLEVTAGPVFQDPTGELTAVRRRLDWYPDAVWRYVVVSGWQRLADTLHLVGRADQLGDATGARILAAEMAGTGLHLAFVLARTWAPYPKWRGTAAAALPVGGVLLPALDEVVAAGTGDERQTTLVRMVEVLVEAQRAAALPVPTGSPVEQFFDRAYVGIRRAVVDGLLDDADAEVRALPHGVGSVEQVTSSAAVLMDPTARVRLARAALVGG